MSIGNIHILTANGRMKYTKDYYDCGKHISITDLGLVISASCVDGWKFTIGDCCTLVAGQNSEITCGEGCMIRAGVGSVIKAGANCVIIRDGDWLPLISKDPVHIMLDNSSIGYEIVKDHNIVIDGEERDISERTYRSIKSLLPF